MLLYICWIISYFCRKSICAFLASCFFRCASNCLISDALILRFKTSPLFTGPVPMLEPLLDDEGEPGVDICFASFPPPVGKLLFWISFAVLCGLELRELVPLSSWKNVKILCHCSSNIVSLRKPKYFHSTHVLDVNAFDTRVIKQSKR